MKKPKPKVKKLKRVAPKTGGAIWFDLKCNSNPPTTILIPANSIRRISKVEHAYNDHTDYVLRIDKDEVVFKTSACRDKAIEYLLKNVGVEIVLSLP